MGKIYFAFGIHNHQPVGNFEFVIEDAYQRAYLPFLDVLEGHPGIRIAMHFSGILLDWLAEHHPDYVERLAGLVRKGQVEMIGGAHFEPILMTIPDRDKVGQIRKLHRTIQRLTGYNAKGLWLAERVWEPHLPKVLREAGVEYTIVDDAHFKYAGLKEDQLTGYFVTEEQGTTLNIFPISERLRYSIPFQEPEATLDYFRHVASLGEDQVAIFADDGEKFGVWPGTYEHVFQHRWLDRFFSALEANADWVEMLHFSEVLDRIAPKGRVYLPTASYREMMEWALPPQAFRELEDFEQKLKELNLFEKYSIYVRGGFWRNFLAKYPESNRMHKKMLYVSNTLEKHRESLSDAALREALDHLWAGQCNCPYWHGIFGGLYLPHLRNAIYRNLIQAERILDTELNRKTARVSVFDLTGNGKEDIIVETPILNLYIDPSLGGNLFELDFKPSAVNLLDTMTRHEEGYHRKLLEKQVPNNPDGEVASIHDLVLTKEEHLERYLKYDSYYRNAWIDHFISRDTGLQQFADCEYHELGDFVNEPYQYQIKEDQKEVVVQLLREGAVFQEGGSIPLRLVKEIIVRHSSGRLAIRYRLENLGQARIRARFGSEWNFALLAGDAPDRYYFAGGVELKDRKLASKGTVVNVQEFGLVDEWQRVRISFRFQEPPMVWRFPIETVSMSEAGFERVYQNSVVVPLWEVDLAPGDIKNIAFDLEIEKVS